MFPSSGFLGSLLVLAFLACIQGLSYEGYALDLKERNWPDPNCRCTPWDYVDQCGDDCRQFRWRDCVPGGCNTEDESVPCYSVEWGEWGDCYQSSSGACERTRSQACMCLMRLVSPDICWVPLKTETEDCPIELHVEEWSVCERTLCRRRRSRSCVCRDSRTYNPVPYSDPSGASCNLQSSGRIETEDCRTEEKPDSWGKCGTWCYQYRSTKCKCVESNPRIEPHHWEVDSSLCNIDAGGDQDKRKCAREWGSWIDLEECPETLPEDHCSVFVRRARECLCIEPSNQNRFAVLGAKCGIAPAISSYACDFAEKCQCTVMPGTPAVCQRTCDPASAGKATGGPPQCMCSPWWYNGECDEEQMVPDWKMCSVEPSKWEEWSEWSDCDDKCMKHRKRRCVCFDGEKHHPSDPSMCPDDGKGNKENQSELSENCDTEWTDWITKPCPVQEEGQCSVTTVKIRQCQCAGRPDIAMHEDKCPGDWYMTVSCKDIIKCQCFWEPGTPANCLRETCDSYPALAEGPKCRCQPPWYQSDDNCNKVPRPPMLAAKECPPSIPFVWTDWSEYGACSTVDCFKRKVRTCKCTELNGVMKFDRSGEKCHGDDEEKEMCDVVWSDWSDGCNPRDLLCVASTVERHRSCCCSVNPNIQWGSTDTFEAEMYCKELGGKATDVETCDVRPYIRTQWSDWSDCDCYECKTKRKRECVCEDSRGRSVDKDHTLCHDEELDHDFEYHDEDLCKTGWSEWSEPECGEKTCVMKTRPKYRDCLCEEAECVNMKQDRKRCPGKIFEMGVKCDFIPPSDPQCSECSCSDWVCAPDCRHWERQCSTPGCDLEVRYDKDSCCDETGTEDPTVTPSVAPSVTPSVAPSVAPSEDPTDQECTCTTWDCDFDLCDETMIRICDPPLCDIHMKPIGQFCCDNGSACSCGEWQRTQCIPNADGSCQEIQARTCIPATCQPKILRTVESTCCDTIEPPTTGEEGEGEGDEDQTEDPTECAACGPWIDIGYCFDENDKHFWRNRDNCDKDICEEYTCKPDGHCREELCGPWYEVGPCLSPTLDPESGEVIPTKMWWRNSEECFCQAYECRIDQDPAAEASDNDVGMLRAQDDCSCGLWRDMTGCDDRCVNTESRDCSPVGCSEEYRIQSGFCCRD